MKNINLFSAKKENIFIYFPIFLLGLTAIELILNKNFYSERSFWLDFLTDIIFLNVVHNIFSYIIIFTSNDYRPWLKAHGGIKFWIKHALMLVIISGVTFVVFTQMKNSAWAVVFSIIVFIALPAHHALSQCLGISLLYSQKEPQIDSLNNLKEKRWLAGFIAFIVLTIGLSTHYQNTTKWYVLLPLAISLIFLILLFLQFNKYPANIRSKKRFFYLRLLHWPLSLFSAVSLFSTKALHGFEYYFVTDKILKNSSSLRFKRLALIALAATVALTCIRLAYFNNTSSTSEQYSVWAALASFSVSLTLVHYYLDRQLYTMRHAINQNTAGRLLLKEND